MPPTETELLLIQWTLFQPSTRLLGPTYYVDATDGSDSNDGLARSRPWQTVAKVNSSTFNPGNIISFKRGDEYREELVVPSSGSASKNLLVKSWGSGARPLLNGSDLVTAWTSYGGAIADDFSGDLSDWTQDIGSWSISAGVVQLDTSGTDTVKLVRHNTEATSADLYAKVKLADIGDDPVGLALRVEASSSWYWVFSTGAAVGWNQYNDAGSWEQSVQSGSLAMANGDVLAAQIAGAGNDTVLKVWKNPTGDTPDDWGAADLTFTNNPSSPVDAKKGVGLAGRYDSTKPQWDDFSAGPGTENVWQASFNPEGTESSPHKVFLDDVLGTDAGSLVAVDAANEWFHDSATDTLYVYSTTDPDTAYTSPGIEASSRDRCIAVRNPANPTFVTVDGIDCEKPNLECVKVEDSSHSFTLKNSILTHSGGSSGFIQANSATNSHLVNVRSTYSGIDTADHAFYMQAPGDANGPYLMEGCEGDNSAGFGVHSYLGASGVHYGCWMHDNTYSGFLATMSQANHSLIYKYCISSKNTLSGWRIQNNNADNIDVALDNCVSAGNTVNGGLEVNNNDSSGGTLTVRNTIFYENSPDEIDIAAASDWAVDLDYNSYFKASGTMIEYEGSSYTQAQFASYQSTEGQDANGISSDPLFDDPGNDDYHLQGGSPCIALGLNLDLILDYDGAPVSDPPNIGAYE